MHFFKLNEYPQSNADTEFSEEDGYNQGDADQCEQCGAYVSMLRWLPPYRVTLELFGERFGDFVFGTGNDFLVSQKFRDVYFRTRLTGLTGFDIVTVTNIKSMRVPRHKSFPQPPAYFRVCPVRGEAAIDIVASGLEWEKPPTCPRCKTGIKKRWKRLVLEQGTWTGEDVFAPRGLSCIMVTQRFKDACEQNGITNAVFIPAESAGHDFYPGEKD